MFSPEIVEDVEAALEQFREIGTALGAAFVTRKALPQENTSGLNETSTTGTPDNA